MYSLLEQDIEIRTFNDFINEARLRKTRNRTVKSTLNMYGGDMWDVGRGYIGPLPLLDNPDKSTIMLNIRRYFTFRNAIAEVVDRAVDGLLSKSPDWKIYNSKDPKNNPRIKARPQPFPEAKFSEDGARIAEETLGTKRIKIDPKIEEAEYILSELWSSAKLGDCLKESLTQFMLEGRGKLRIYFPKKKEGIAKDFTEVTRFIKAGFIHNDKAEILDDGADKLSIIEISKKKDTTKTFEISFVSDNGSTYVGTIKSDQRPTEELDGEDDDIDEAIVKISAVAQLSTPMKLGGYLTADEILGKPFVTESMLQNNRALNLALSLGVGVLVEAGFPELVTTNVAMKKKTIDDPDNPGESIEVDEVLERGATTLVNLIGEQSTDAQGNTQFQNPGVYWKNPTPLDAFIQGEELYYRQILSEAKQLFVLTTDDSIMSGESRIQARQDFLKKIQRYKPSLDNHGTWLLNTILRFAASACGKDGYFDDISVIFDSKIYAGELSADEKNVVISQYTAEPPLIARETAMVLLGTEDPIIEIDKIRTDQAEKLEFQVRRLEATSKFGNMSENGQPKATPDEKANVRVEQKKKISK
ncbi:MAG: hypothetical protein WBP82_09180 [Leuconostoc mesenteroides]